MIDLEEVRALAVHRAYDVLGDDALGVVGYLELQPDAVISVLIALERIEERRNGPSPPSSGSTDDRIAEIHARQATLAETRMAQSPGWVD